MFTVRTFDEVTSTNDLVKRALEAGEPEGLVVRAQKQTGGYGRQGRAWASPEGGLYASFLLRPEVDQAQLPTLSLVVALAVRRALAALVDAPYVSAIQVKWPNDVVLSRETSCEEEGSARAKETGFSKLCGISLEAHAGGICVGVGINVVAPNEVAFDIPGKNRPAYVADMASALKPLGTQAALDAVFEAELSAFQTLYRQWLSEGFQPFVELFNRYSALQDLPVAIEDRLGNLLGEGCVCGIDCAGQLLLTTPDGASVALASGEAHLIPCS
ncbi:biotin--[acetyl-CoA-carboxylase] ligase [Adlercreutzia agrestimuris]|uniref:biotin--[acetyl-CoA-carboxylase] ligase n=1 Tax=Adlercreutzia agrestimuris TaxID=2941324 RepID=UPI002041474A|nr:biotin--[acetyl-CoA-carboxylase] ligase [Adlercreutzia agrestimuris]